MRCRHLVTAMAVLLLVGCAHPQTWPMFARKQNTEEWTSPQRLNRGLAIVLPGIESDSHFVRGLAEGIVDGGFPGAVDVDDWTTGELRHFIKHQIDIERNRQEAARIADKIIRYQDHYPDRPVYLVGFSGGGGVVILILESLPKERTIAGAVLLEAAISPNYDLTNALAYTDRGIWNFSSKWDAILLRLGTRFAGTIDREYSDSAGAVGFVMPENLDETGKLLYAERLHEIPYSAKKMMGTGHFGGHFGATNRRFSEEWIAPLLVP